LRGGFPAESVEGLSLHITDAVSAACGASAKKLKFSSKKRGVYWWNDNVVQSRRRCIAARRLLTSKRRRGGQCDSLLFKKARTTLCKSIKKVKSEAWSSLIGTLDDDPWGLPYKIVMNRLRRSGSALSESLEPRIIDRLLDELFPPDEVHNPDEIWVNDNVYDPAYRVSTEEVACAIRGRRRGDCPAPGPDGLSLDLWKRAPRCVLDALATLYTRCLEEGKVPRAWNGQFTYTKRYDQCELP